MSKRRIITALAVIVITGSWTAAGAQEASTPEQVAMRRQIALMQTALEAAVASGAMDLGTQLSRVTGVPPETHLIGRPAAEGFRLTGQIFFHVRVPDVSAVLVYALPALIRDRPQLIAGARVSPTQAVADRTRGSSAPPVAPLDVAPVIEAPEVEALLRDPDAARTAYVDAIRANLIDTMLKNSYALEVPSDEFLTVAARKDQRSSPLDPTSGRTMVFTVKGSDLEAYHQSRISLDEARKLVVVTTY